MAQTPIELVSGLLSTGKLVEFKNELYFAARGRETAASPLSGSELWKIDAQGNATLLKDIASGPANASPAELTVVGNNLYFTARDSEHGLELWKTDGTREGTQLVRDIAPGTADSSVSQLTAAGDQLYFVADDGVAGLELWKSNGTNQGTSLVVDLVAGTGDAMLSQLTAVGNKLFFAADDGNSGGRELWSSNGSAAGTALVSNINPVGASDPGSLISWNSKLYFAATTPAAGRELWTSDGTPAGTRIVADIFGGASSAFNGDPQFVATSDSLYFAAGTAALGLEPWSLNTAGLVANVGDINPGGGGSSPGFLGTFGRQVLFSANSGGGSAAYLAGGNLPGPVLFATELGVGLGGILYVDDPGLVFTSGNAYWQTDDGLDNTQLIAEPSEGVGPSGLLGSRVIFPSGSRLLAIDVDFGGPTVVLGDVTINEGAAVTLDASNSADPDGLPLTYSWDLNGDGVFGDATGVKPNVSWAQLNGFGITDDGTYAVTVRVLDAEGKTAEDSASLIVNNTSPVLDSYGAPLFARVNNSISFIATASDGGGAADPLTFAWNFGDGQSATGATTAHAYASAGTFTVTLTVTDDEGATTINSQGITIQIIAPDADAGGPYAIDEAGGEVQLDASASSDPNGAAISISWDLNGDGLFGDATGATPAFTWAELAAFGIDDDGEYPLRVRVTDPQGVSAEDVAILTVRNIAPTLTEFSAQDFGRAFMSFAFTANATDPNDPVSYVWDFGDGSNVATGASVNHVYLTPGTFDATLTVSDGDGGVVVRSQEVIVEPVVPVTTAGGPYTMPEGGEVTLDASASVDPNGDQLTFTWDLNDDGIYGDTTGAMPTVTWDRLGSLNPPISEDGVYPISVRATDPDGNSSLADSTLTVTNAPPTVIVLTVPTIANPGTEVGMAVIAEDFAGAADPLTYTWDFGDASSVATGRQVTHTYAEAGAYTVTMIVRDDDGGETTATSAIRISNDSNPPVLDTGGPYVITEGETLVLDATKTVDPLGRRLIYLWDLTGNGIADVSSFGVATVEWADLLAIQGSDANDGTQVLDLLVASLFDADVVVAQTTLTIVNAPPVINSVNIPSQVTVGSQSVLTATAVDPNPNDTLSYTWDFGDGTTAAGPTVAKVFASTGTYAVGLTVDDGDGGIVSAAYSVQVVDVLETVPPQVISVARDDGTRFDLLDSYAITFSEDVSASLTADDLRIVNSITNEVVDSSSATVVWDTDTNTAVWDLSGLGLAKGRYQLVLASAAIQDAAGNVLDGDGDGSAGGDFSRAEVLTWQGDANLDLKVEFADFLVVANNFGSAATTDWAMGDFDADGVTAFSDFLALANNFGKQVAAAAAARAFAAHDGTDWWLL